MHAINSGKNSKFKSWTKIAGMIIVHKKENTNKVMSTVYYRDYFWKEGIPVGKDPLEEPTGPCYKIVTDPYRKRITVEKYVWGDFDLLEYDTLLLDFRTLKLENQHAWEKKMLEEEHEHATSLIRDQNDRVILMETYTFKNNRCVECRTYYPMGILVSLQKIFYKEFGDSFNGVTLHDAHGRQVVHKEYEIDPITKEFGVLLVEKWS